jgi:hypothetical protein
MTESETTPIPIPEDVAAVHDILWQKLARPGAWWSGQQRVAIAAEARQARRCRLCEDRKQALSPEAVSGSHDRGSDEQLPVAAVEATHRIASDPGRLRHAFYQSVRDAGVSDGHYVELVGITSRTVMFDVYQRAMGGAPRPLPEPSPGEPSCIRPQGVTDSTAWVPMLSPRLARGPEADLYPTPQAPNVIRALSLCPDEVRQLLWLEEVQYVESHILDLDFDRVLSRPQIELLTARVSAQSRCFY